MLASNSKLRAAVESLRSQVLFASHATDYLADREIEHLRARGAALRAEEIAAVQDRARTAAQELPAFVHEHAPGLASAPWSAFADGANLVQPANALQPPWLRVYDMALPDGGAVARISPFLDEDHAAFVYSGSRLGSVVPSVAGLLLRVLATTRPGDVQVRVYDPEGLGSSLSWVGSLVEMGVATPPATDTAGLMALLEEASADIATTSSNLLKGVHETVADASRAEGRRVTPWKVLVLLGEPEGYRAEEVHRLLQRVASEGVRHGIHLIRAVSDATFQLGSPGWVFAAAESPLDRPKDQGGPDLPRIAVRVVESMRAYLAENAPSKQQFLEIHDAARGQIPSLDKGIHLPVGVVADTGVPAIAVLNDQTPHAMLMGPSGSGKTEAIHTIASSVMASYSPDEVQVYLLDMKGTLDFTRRYGAFDGHPAAPHVPVLGSTDDVEYGEALLRWLVQEMVRRNKNGGSNYAALRAASTEPVPRLLVIIDEFQNLFSTEAGNGPVVASNVALLTRLAREARSAGIHLLLATQTMSGIAPLIGAGKSILNQFQLRIALPNASGVLDIYNTAAESLPAFHAVINHSGGVASGNMIAHIVPPNPEERQTLLEAAMRQAPHAEQQFFEGRTLPDPAPVLDTVAGPSPTTAAVFAGMSVALTPQPVLLPLRRGPGGNIAIVGNRDVDGHNASVDVVLAGVAGLLRTAPSNAEIHVVPVHSESHDLAEEIRTYGTAHGREVTVHDRTDLTPLVVRWNEAVTSRSVTAPTFLVLLGMDASTNLLAEAHEGTTGKKALQTLLKHGPDYGVHTVAWWRQGQRIGDALDLTTKGVFGGWIGMSNKQDLGYFGVQEWTNPDTRVLACDTERTSTPMKTIPAGPMSKESD